MKVQFNRSIHGSEINHSRETAQDGDGHHPEEDVQDAGNPLPGHLLLRLLRRWQRQPALGNLLDLREAQFWLSEQTQLHAKRAAPTQRPHFVSDLLDAYLEHQTQEHDNGNLRPRSLADYTRVAGKLRAVLPDVELDHLTTEQVKEAMKSLEKTRPAGGRRVVTVGGKRKVGAPRKASAQEANRALRQLRRMLKFGQANGWVGKNVASLIKPISRSTVKSGEDAEPEAEKIWTLAEVQAFLTTALTHRQYAMLYLMLSYGPRVGEMMGLRWSDLDLTEGRMKIARSYDPVYGLCPPKGGVARTVLIAPNAVEALRVHQERQRREQATATPISAWCFPPGWAATPITATSGGWSTSSPNVPA